MLIWVVAGRTSSRGLALVDEEQQEDSRPLKISWPEFLRLRLSRSQKSRNQTTKRASSSTLLQTKAADLISNTITMGSGLPINIYGWSLRITRASICSEDVAGSGANEQPVTVIVIADNYRTRPWQCDDEWKISLRTRQIFDPLSETTVGIATMKGCKAEASMMNEILSFIVFEALATPLTRKQTRRSIRDRDGGCISLKRKALFSFSLNSD